MKREESNNRQKKLRSYKVIKHMIGFLFLISFITVIGTSNQLDVQEGLDEIKADLYGRSYLLF